MPDLPLTEQTLYAELVDRCSTAAFETDFSPSGGFVKVTVKGRNYWYFQQSTRDASGHQPRKYVGPDTPEIRELIENHGRAKDDYRERRHIIATLRRSGFQSPPEQIGRILQVLSAAGIFRMRACLIGTTAYQLYGQLLGARLPHVTLQTNDIDIAQFTAISLAISKDERTPPLIEILKEADPSFRSIPHSQARNATATYINRHGYRVEVLTENRGPETERPARLPAIGTDAQRLRFLEDQIIEEAQSLRIGNVPPPARYALHKLIVAQRRREGATKVNKDLEQAEALIDAVAGRRPKELDEAWRDALERGPRWQHYLTTGLGMISARVRDKALHVFGTARSTIPGQDLQFSDAPPRYDFVRDAIFFDGHAGRERVICGISREALDDHFGADGLGKQERLKLFRRHRAEIQEIAKAIYLHKPVSAENLVLITTEDVSYLRRPKAMKKTNHWADAVTLKNVERARRG